MKVIAKYKTPSIFSINCPTCGKEYNFYQSQYGRLVLEPDVDEGDIFEINESGVSVGLLRPQFVCLSCPFSDTLVISNYKAE